MVTSISPDKKQEVKAKQLEALKKLGHIDLQLDEYERTVANEIIHPDDISVRFSGALPYPTRSPSHQLTSIQTLAASNPSFPHCASLSSTPFSIPTSSHPHPSSAHPKVSCSLALPAAAKPCSPKPSPKSQAQPSSTSPLPSSRTSGMANPISSSPGSSVSRARRSRASFLSTRSTPSCAREQRAIMKRQG